MSYIKITDRTQLTFLPDCLDDFVTDNNPVRVIDAFVNSLNMVELGFSKAVSNDNCRPCYDPKDLLKCYIYGYINRIRSSRRLMTECARNVELMWLMGRLVPDFRTIADFRKDNSLPLKRIFRAFVKLCDELELYGKELFSIDGTKFKAVNSKDNNFTVNKLKDRIKWIDESIEHYLNELNYSDVVEVQEKQLSGKDIQGKIDALKARKSKYENYIDVIIASDDTQLSITDPESKLMMANGKLDVCYNVQAAVDAKNHLIADYIVDNNAADAGYLKITADEAKAALSIKTVETLADAGYDNKYDAKDCLFSGTFPNVYFNKKRNHKKYIVLSQYEPKEIADEIRNSKEPGDIETCLKAGVVPAVYADKNIKVEVMDEYDEPNYMLCPVSGCTITYAGETTNLFRFLSPGACRYCKNKCLKQPRKNKRRQSNYVGNMITRPKNREGARTIVRITIASDTEKLKQRKCLSEHPFGTVKHWGHGSFLLTKGKTKVSAEIALSFLAYNFKRLINLVKVDKILAKC